MLAAHRKLEQVKLMGSFDVRPALPHGADNANVVAILQDLDLQREKTRLTFGSHRDECLHAALKVRKQQLLFPAALAIVMSLADHSCAAVRGTTTCFLA